MSQLYVRKINWILLTLWMLLFVGACFSSDTQGVATDSAITPTSQDTSISAVVSGSDLNPITDTQSSTDSANDVSDIVVSQYVTEYENLLKSIYQNNIPSVVTINVLELGGSGSGWVWNEDGYIVTNQHVVADADTVLVKFSNGIEAEADVIASDIYADIAVVKVDSLVVKPLKLGNNDDISPGNLAIAMGNPFGEEFTMTVGIVSAVFRSIRSTNANYLIPDAIQVDAALNPGNSGGPLFNSRGEVIGMNTLIDTQTGTNTGIGFAVPINLIKKVVPKLIEDREYKYPLIGMTGTSLNLSIREEAGIDSDVFGVIVTSISPGSGAEEAGMLGDSYEGCGFFIIACMWDGDIIVAVDDAEVRSFDDLIAYITLTKSPGDVIDLQIVRNGQNRTISVTLGAR